MNQNSGIIWVPYVIVTTATYVNGEMVWHRNRWIRALLSVRRFFFRSANLRSLSKYAGKTVDPGNYSTITIKGE